MVLEFISQRIFLIKHISTFLGWFKEAQWRTKEFILRDMYEPVKSFHGGKETP